MIYCKYCYRVKGNKYDERNNVNNKTSLMSNQSYNDGMET